MFHLTLQRMITYHQSLQHFSDVQMIYKQIYLIFKVYKLRNVFMEIFIKTVQNQIDLTLHHLVQGKK